MDIKTRETFSEVYSILNILGKKYTTKLPTSLYKMIIEEKSHDYKPQYNSAIALSKQNIKKEALSMIALLHLNYWCSTQEEKQELKKMFSENEVKYQNELRETFNPDNIFKKYTEKNPMKDMPENTNNIELIEYKASFFTELKNFIFKILHINK